MPGLHSQLGHGLLCEASIPGEYALRRKTHHASTKVHPFQARIEQVKGGSRALFVDHELEAQTDAMTTKDCKNAKREPTVPAVEFAPTLVHIYSLGISSEGRQPSQEGKDRMSL